MLPSGFRVTGLENLHGIQLVIPTTRANQFLHSQVPAREGDGEGEGREKQRREEARAAEVDKDEEKPLRTPLASQ